MRGLTITNLANHPSDLSLVELEMNRTFNFDHSHVSLNQKFLRYSDSSKVYILSVLHYLNQLNTCELETARFVAFAVSFGDLPDFDESH